MFARSLGLTGDPYAAVLALEGWPTERLRALLAPPPPPVHITLHPGDRAELTHVQMVPGVEGWELKSLAVLDGCRRTGLGRRLVDAGLDYARDHGARRVVVSTGAADTGVVRFYLRAGFRPYQVDRDIFTAEAGYPPIVVDGDVPLVDRLWLDRELT
ncbi:MAG: GNAT family N-acetyltransferase [Myxococcota bacterium]